MREQRRGSAHARGYDRSHQRRRTLVLHRDPICRGCQRQPSTIADHIIRISDGGSKSDLTNQQGLCTDCHGYKIVAEQQDLTFGPRLAAAGALLGEPAPPGWALVPPFGREGW